MFDCLHSMFSSLSTNSRLQHYPMAYNDTDLIDYWGYANTRKFTMLPRRRNSSLWLYLIRLMIVSTWPITYFFSVCPPHNCCHVAPIATILMNLSSCRMCVCVGGGWLAGNKIQVIRTKWIIKAFAKFYNWFTSLHIFCCVVVVVRASKGQVYGS